MRSRLAVRCSIEVSPYAQFIRHILRYSQTKFFVGLHHPSDGQHFQYSCMSVRSLWRRRKPIIGTSVLIDSGAFNELKLHGRYRESARIYAKELFRLWQCGVVPILGAVAQDYMCEPFMLRRTGLSVQDHQNLTIERYDALVCALEELFGVPFESVPFEVIPVLQGYDPADYVRHIRAYGDRLQTGMWVGVGSVCKRNGAPDQIKAVLKGIRNERPDLRLHGFGVKTTSLSDPFIRASLFSADSMAWSFAARKQGRDANSWQEAKRFEERVQSLLAA